MYSVPRHWVKMTRLGRLTSVKERIPGLKTEETITDLLQIMRDIKGQMNRTGDWVVRRSVQTLWRKENYMYMILVVSL